MSKPVKDIVSRQIAKWGEGVTNACLVNLSGLNAVKTNRLRGALKKKNIQVHIVKNSLAKRAFSSGPLKPLAEAMEGPCALVYGEPAIIEIAKELIRWAKEYKEIELKTGLLEGESDLFSVEEISRMKSRNELIGEIAMLLLSPIRRLAGAMASPGAQIAGCLKTMIEKNESKDAA